MRLDIDSKQVTSISHISKLMDVLYFEISIMINRSNHLIKHYTLNEPKFVFISKYYEN